MKSNAERAVASQSGSPKTTLARASAAIISPFQSARTLSSRPGLAASFAEREQLAPERREIGFLRRPRRGRRTRRSTVLPSQLPPGVTS